MRFDDDAGLEDRSVEAISQRMLVVSRSGRDEECILPESLQREHGPA